MNLKITSLLLTQTIIGVFSKSPCQGKKIIDFNSFYVLKNLSNKLYSTTEALYWDQTDSYIGLILERKLLNVITLEQSQSDNIN
jgi:hypothetical protein